MGKGTTVAAKSCESGDHDGDVLGMQPGEA